MRTQTGPRRRVRYTGISSALLTPRDIFSRIIKPSRIHEHVYVALQEKKIPLALALEHAYSARLLTCLVRGAGSAASSDGTQQLPLVSAAEMRVFESLSPLLDPNPRRLKRIINVYALATEVAKRTPLSDVNPTACVTVYKRDCGATKPEFPRHTITCTCSQVS